MVYGYVLSIEITYSSVDTDKGDGDDLGAYFNIKSLFNGSVPAPINIYFRLFHEQLITNKEMFNR